MSFDLKRPVNMMQARKQAIAVPQVANWADEEDDVSDQEEEKASDYTPQGIWLVFNSNARDYDRPFKYIDSVTVQDDLPSAMEKIRLQLQNKHGSVHAFNPVTMIVFDDVAYVRVRKLAHYLTHLKSAVVPKEVSERFSNLFGHKLSDTNPYAVLSTLEED